MLANLDAEDLEDEVLYDPADSTLEVVADEQTSSGPEWVGLGTFDPPVPLEVDGDVLKVRSRALNVPTTSDEGTPRFLGAAYCTFVAR